MLEARHRLVLEAEAVPVPPRCSGALAVDLQGDDASRILLAGLVDDTHASSSQALEELVASEPPRERSARLGPERCLEVEELADLGMELRVTLEEVIAVDAIPALLRLEDLAEGLVQPV